MDNQHQAGIDLSQAASNLGDTVASTQPPEAKAQTTAGREPQPELSERDDPLLNELRKQCQLHHSELSFLAGLDLPGAPYQDVWLGPGGAELAPLLPDATPLSLEQVGAEADLQEFESSSISLVGRNGDMLYIRYQDGTVECCLRNPQGQKHGPFALYYPSLFYLRSQPQFESHLHQHLGFFYQGLPCGPFELYDENGVCICKGCYELMETGFTAQSQAINLKQLLNFINNYEQAANLNEVLIPDDKVDKDIKPTWKQESMFVLRDCIVIRYSTLSHSLPHGQSQSFGVEPEHPAVLLQRHANETWLQALMRAHQRVLHLVQTQINHLRQAQRAAAQLLAPAQTATAEPDLNELKSQLTAPCFDDEVGRKVHQRCLEHLGKLQPEALVTNCKRGGYAPGLLDCLPRTADGRYLNGILVSSPEYFERQSYRCQVEQTRGTKSDALLQDNPMWTVLRLAYFLHYQQNDKMEAPDLDQIKVTYPWLIWMKELFAPALPDAASEPPFSGCTCQCWGELQLNSMVPDRPRAQWTPVPTTKDALMQLTADMKQYYSAYFQPSDLTSYGLRWGHYFCSAKRGIITNAKVQGFNALPIWAQWDIAPINVDAPQELLNCYFCWHAAGASTLYDDNGSYVGHIDYKNFGLCDGAFQLYDVTKETSVQGQLKHGQLQPTLHLTIYQDYRSRFPAATLTVDLAQGSFRGSYHTIYGIDELFELGYHAVLLETYGEIETEDGTKKLKRLIQYTPGSYLKERGVYQADGTIQVTTKYRLEEYVRPAPYRPRYYHHWDYDDDLDEDELAELWGDDEDDEDY